jgi:hypothetical protein
MNNELVEVARKIILEMDKRAENVSAFPVIYSSFTALQEILPYIEKESALISKKYTKPFKVLREEYNRLGRPKEVKDSKDRAFHLKMSLIVMSLINTFLLAHPFPSTDD